MCSPRKSDENFSILTFLWIKTNVAYTRLEMIAKQRSALQVWFITGVKLICYFVLYYGFLHWSHLPNMAVGDLAFYYTLYLCYLHVPHLGWTNTKICPSEEVRSPEGIGCMSISSSAYDGVTWLLVQTLKGHWTTSASSPNFFQKSWDFYIIRSVYLCSDCMLNLTCSFNSFTKIYAFFFQ